MPTIKPLHLNGLETRRAGPGDVIGVENGGTGESSLQALKVALELDSVDNTSDLDKPVPTQVTLALADINSSKVDVEPGRGLSDENYSTVEKNKLATVEEGSTQNSTDGFLLERSNHTGTQEISTIVGLSQALNSKQGSLVAGENITITGNTISAVGGGSGGVFNFIYGQATTGSASFLTPAPATQIDAYDIAHFRSAKYVVSGVSGQKSHVLEILTTHNTVFATELLYGELATDELLFTTQVELVGSEVVLLATPLVTPLTITILRTILS